MGQLVFVSMCIYIFIDMCGGNLLRSHIYTRVRAQMPTRAHTYTFVQTLSSMHVPTLMPIQAYTFLLCTPAHAFMNLPAGMCALTCLHTYLYQADEL